MQALCQGGRGRPIENERQARPFPYLFGDLSELRQSAFDLRADLFDKAEGKASQGCGVAAHIGIHNGRVLALQIVIAPFEAEIELAFVQSEKRTIDGNDHDTAIAFDGSSADLFPFEIAISRYRHTLHGIDILVREAFGHRVDLC